MVLDRCATENGSGSDMYERQETEPNLFDAATRLSSKSRSSGEKKVRAERTIISYNLPELWLRQIYEIV
jgi:hypothetical protein